MLRRWCFIATQNFKLKNITRCELWKRQIPPWIVTLLFGTIQHWFCLFHSSHLLMCFNLKFCVPIKHHPLNIPHFFDFFWNFKTSFSRGFHRFPPNVGFRMISPPLRARSESCVLTGQNPNPTDRTCAPLDAPRSNGNPEPFRQHMQYMGKHCAHASCSSRFLLY